MEPELERLRIRVEELERRLAAVEGRVGMAPVMVAPPPPPVVLAPPVFVPPTPVVVSEADTVETNAGLVWANRIGAVTMILGVAFAFLYAVDNEMIGPTGRVLCGLVAAMVALLAGDKLWHRGHRVFAQGITALGICILYFSFYAAYQLYHLIPQAMAFGGAVVTTALGGALALRYDARTIAVLALFGGYLSPFLASSGSGNDAFLGSYLLVLNAVALSLGRRKSWVAVEVMAAVSTVVLFGVWFGERRAEMSPAFAGFAVGQFVVFALSPTAVIRWTAPVAAMFAVGWMCSPGASSVYWGWAAVVSLVGLGLGWREGDDRRLAASVVGWAAGFVQLEFDREGFTYTFTTENCITPNNFYFSDCHGSGCRGTLV